MSEINKSYEREFARLERQEEKFLERRRSRKSSKIGKVLEEKVPEGLQEKLETVFCKMFKVLLERGTVEIERTFSRRKKELKWDQKLQHAQILRDSASIRNLSKEANIDSVVSILASAASGIGLGSLGIGIPDIPLFAATLLRDVYARAANYGYDYDSTPEKYFILLLLQGAFSYGEELEKTDVLANRYISTGKIPEGASVDKEIQKASRLLSSEILVTKFVQCVPVVGAAGGAFDALYMMKLAEYADLKYRRRVLEDHAPSLNSDHYNPIQIIKQDPEVN